MSNVVLYRKYRPEKWSEVRGQEHVVDVLRGAIKEGNAAHAYLFAGTRGTGKTSVARIFAEEVGTKKQDLYEIDAASNRGIDDVRELREAVRVLPFDSQYKVYIIDEVHMLTKEAFNALLKTLEEPPKHVIFILATTELQKLPDTIVSRCQTFTFKKPSQQILKTMVLDTAKKEGFSIEPASADLVALLADGSFRDAQGILQKVVSTSTNKKISREEIERTLGAPSVKMVNSIIEAIAHGNTEQGISAIRTADEQNIDMVVFAKLILNKLRAILLLRFASTARGYLKDDFSEEDLVFLDELAKSKDVHINSGVLARMIDAYQMIGRSYIPTLPLELAMIDFREDKKYE